MDPVRPVQRQRRSDPTPPPSLRDRPTSPGTPGGLVPDPVRTSIRRPDDSSAPRPSPGREERSDSRRYGIRCDLLTPGVSLPTPPPPQGRTEWEDTEGVLPRVPGADLSLPPSRRTRVQGSGHGQTSRGSSTRSRSSLGTRRAPTGGSRTAVPLSSIRTPYPPLLVHYCPSCATPVDLRDPTQTVVTEYGGALQNQL